MGTDTVSRVIRCSEVYVFRRARRDPECKQHLSQGLIRIQTHRRWTAEGDGDDDPTDHQERQPGLQEPHEAAGHERKTFKPAA